jgi:outer membrane protein assembly factor BamA
MLRRLTCLLALLLPIQAQNASFPLESVSLEGTTLSKQTVIEIAGLRIGALVDKTAIERACEKLRDSGMFQSITYRYAPGPKRGYALTLIIADHESLADSTLDFPGIDDNALWQWLVSQYPAFNHKVPGNDAAQQFIAKKIEAHLGPQLEGQRVVARMDADLFPRRRMVVSFQPETLPQVAAMIFSGQHELTSDELASLIRKIVAARGYTDRYFREIVELNLRRAYEEHGMYRVRFSNITAQKTSASSVAVTTTIEEGMKFKLGEVQLIGDNLPIDAMVKSGKFKKGQIANWTEIEQCVRDSELPLKRTGYFDAAGRPERILHDNEQLIYVKVSFVLGPFYRVGQLRVTGLTPALETQARKVWKLQPGDPYDYDYPGDFLRAFFHSVDSRQFAKYNVLAAKSSGDHVIDFNLVFEPKAK